MLSKPRTDTKFCSFESFNWRASAGAGETNADEVREIWFGL